MSAVSFAPELRAAAFDVADAALVGDMGNVSILKFLGGRDEADATERWFSVIEAFLAPLPEGVFERLDLATGRPVLEFRGGVRLTVDLFGATARPTFDDAWTLRMKPGLAPLVLDAVAAALGSDAWTSALAHRDGLPIVPAGDLFDGWARSVRAELEAADAGERARGWVIQADPAFAPFPWLTDLERARRGAAALALGPDEAVRLFQETAGGRA